MKRVSNLFLFKLPNKFTYVIKGTEEAKAAGKAIKDAGLKFDIAHTSVLTRAQVTLNSILTESGQTGIPIEKTWRLNERHYGGLTGLNKAETAAKYGEDQVSFIVLLHNQSYFCFIIISIYRYKFGVAALMFLHQL